LRGAAMAVGRSSSSAKYSPLEVQDRESASATQGQPVADAAFVGESGFLERRCRLLPAAQVAAALIPLAFCNTVLAEFLAPLAIDMGVSSEENAHLAFLPPALPLVVPLVGLLLSPAIGASAEWGSRQPGECSGSHRPLILAGLIGVLFGLFLVALAPESAGRAGATLPGLLVLGFGCSAVGVAHALLGVGLRARLAEGVAPQQLGTAFALAALFGIVGDTLGHATAGVDWGLLAYFNIFATEACSASSVCFNARFKMLVGMVLALLGNVLAVLAGIGRGSRRVRWKSARLPPLFEQQPEGPSVVEVVLEDPGAKAVLLASGLSWAGLWALEAHLDRFVAREVLGPTEGPGAVRAGRLLRLAVGGPVALGLPRLLSTLGGFGLWLSGSLTMAALLLIGPAVRAFPQASLVAVWAAAFGAVYALQAAVPYAILARRTRARSTSVAVAIAIANVPSYAAQLCWFWAADSVHSWLQSDVSVFGVGAVCAGCAAAVCSYALVGDRDKPRSTAREISEKLPSAIPDPLTKTGAPHLTDWKAPQSEPQDLSSVGTSAL